MHTLHGCCCCGLRNGLVFVGASTLFESGFLILKSLMLRQDFPNIIMYLEGHMDNPEKYGFDTTAIAKLRIFSLIAVIIGAMNLLAGTFLCITMCRLTHQTYEGATCRISLMIYGISRLTLALFCLGSIMMMVSCFQHPEEQITWLIALAVFAVLSMYFLMVLISYYKVMGSRERVKVVYVRPVVVHKGVSFANFYDRVYRNKTMMQAEEV